MARTASWGPNNEYYIRINSRYMTVQAMAAHLGLPDQTIYNICRLRGYQFKKHPEGRTYGFQHSKTRKEREIVEKPSSGKPPTQYSNTGYLALLQKYSD